ncbi:Na-Ca exchanger/integrin-beta4 [Calothrix sp. NIES-4071]|nr:Na-Ca exchanger/integrin-beta4 [Calothrix sp. NIES-4071]BAZ59562.1 Na-Ca exchanger/integrin-beta4 [Calothrix sp. NIES-4105]
MEIITGNSNDTVIRPTLVNGVVFRSNDVIRTNGGNDTINPGLGEIDYVYGGDGIDHLILDYSIGDTGTGILFTGSSARRWTDNTNNRRTLDSILYFDIEQFTITGTSKDDTFNLSTTNSVIRAGAGNDQVSVTQPITGNIGTLDGGVGFDYLVLDLSNQTANLTLTNLQDINIAGVVRATNFERFSLETGSGNDTVLQSGIVNGSVLRQNDLIKTGAGNDTINAGLGSDTVLGGDGLDHLIIDYSVGDTGTGMRFNGSNFYGTASRDISTTNPTNLDFIEFNGIERFTVTGTSKADSLFAAGGNDIINAGTGNDTIRGGAGGDLLTGGSGLDTFQYQSLTDSLLSNYDVITDLQIGIDVIDSTRAISATQIRKLGYVSALTETAIQEVLTPTNFVVNGASTFKFRDGLIDRSFLGLNDGRAGFSATTDSIIEITGFTGNLNNLSLV